MSFAQFFVLSPRGDCIVSKDFVGDAHATLYEDFLHKIKFWKEGTAPPVFEIDQLHYFFIKRSSLYIAVTSHYNISPTTTLELLSRVAKIFQDYCGVLSEESIRLNFSLIYELLEEIFDYGFAQSTSTEVLKYFIHNEPVVPRRSNQVANFVQNLASRTKSKSQSNMPIAIGSARSSRKNELYLDLVERISVTMESSGTITNSGIDGKVVIRSFLSGNPELLLAFNEDLVVGEDKGGSVVMDAVSFHDCIKTDRFDKDKLLRFNPPEGEFTALNYRMSAGSIRVPFRLKPTITEPASHRLELKVFCKCDLLEGSHASKVMLIVPVPANTVSVGFDVSVDIQGLETEYTAAEKRAVLVIPKLPGQSEFFVKFRIGLEEAVTPSSVREVGPVSMAFDVPQTCLSKLAIKFLRVSDAHKGYNYQRWVKSMSTSSSYICRVIS